MLRDEDAVGCRAERIDMDNSENTPAGPDATEWFAIRTRQDFRAESMLKPLCAEVFFPKRIADGKGERRRERAYIPHVLFIRTTRERAMQLEQAGREHPERSVPFWIYRYPNDHRIQVIPQRSIDLLRLLTATDSTRCEIFSKTDFKENQRVRITGGPFEGYEGYVQRVKKNKHVIVRIEGICLLMLPFIHPDLLKPLSP